MKIAALSAKDPWLGRIDRRSDIETIELANVAVEMNVSLDRVEILHHGPERNYRPYLHMIGFAESIVPNEELVYGINEISYPQTDKPKFDAFFEFTDADLADLALKGAWNTGFSIPDVVVESAWQLPGTANIVILPPASLDAPPVLFIDIENERKHEYDDNTPEKSSGYGGISAYFPAIEQVVQAEAEGEIAGPSVTHVRDNIFSGVDLGEQRLGYDFDGLTQAEREAEVEAGELAESERAAQYTGLIPNGVFEKLFIEHESVNPTITAPPAVEPEPSLEGDALVYEVDIAPSVREAMESPSESGNAIASRLRHGRANTAVEEVTEVVTEADAGGNIDFSAVSTMEPVEDQLPDILVPELPDNLRPRAARRAAQHSAAIDSHDEDLLRKEAERRAHSIEPEL